MSTFSRYVFVLLFCLASGGVFAVPVDLSSWSEEGGGTWTLQSGNNAVIQSINGDPTIYHNGLDSQGSQLSGEITVQTTGDDDFIGFVLGYNSGDISSSSTDYLLIDWKQSNQSGFFGGTSLAGLSISRVTDVLDDGAGAWLHESSDGVEELQRATNLGSTGWVDNTTYEFDLIFTSSLVEVFVDSVKELSISGSFNDGSFGFYNYSQASVLYAGITQVAAPTTTVPEPMSIMLLGLGLVGIFASKRKNRLINYLKF